MIPDRLFELALAYRKTKLWKKLWDSQLFALRFSDGGIGYCCVMGMNDELNAIAVYPGQKGLDSLRKLHRDISMTDVLAHVEQMSCQDCLMLSFTNKSGLNPRDIEALEPYCQKNAITLRGRKAYPQFERFRPGYERWYMEDETDQRHMIEALEVAIGLSNRLTSEKKTAEQLGLFTGLPFDREIPLYTLTAEGLQSEMHPLPPEAPEVYPPIIIDDDLSRAKLQKAVRKGEWAVKLFRHVDSMAMEQVDGDMVLFEDLTAPPVFPWALLILDLKMGLIAGLGISGNVEDYSPDLTQTIVEAAAIYGLPKKITVIDDRTAQAMGRFCEDYGITLQRKARCKALQEALDDLIQQFMAADLMDGPDDDDMPDAMDWMLEMLSDPHYVRELPDELLLQLLNTPGASVLPNGISSILKKEADRRGLNKR